MRSLRSLLSLKPKDALVVGVEFQREAIGLVAQRFIGGSPKVTIVEYADQPKIGEQFKFLGQWIGQHHLEGAICNVVLSPEDYQLLLVEPPDVPDEEVRGAIRWRLKDLISISPENAALDVFFLPQDGTKANKKMVYVVVAEADKIKKLIEIVGDLGLRLNAIDIGELAIRNLAVRLLEENEAERGVAIARIGRGSGSVYIYRAGNMYLARSFAIDYNGGLLDDLPQESLALELQRSMDYYERQMGQAPPAKIFICGDHLSEDKIGATLKASLAIKLELLDPARSLEFQEDCETERLPHCIGALGAALRISEVD